MRLYDTGSGWVLPEEVDVHVPSQIEQLQDWLDLMTDADGEVYPDLGPHGLLTN